MTDLRPYSPILTDYFTPESESEAETEIDRGHVGVAVPIPDDGYFYGFQVGDTLSITASFLYIDVDEASGYQTTPSPVIPEGVVVDPSNAANPRLIVQEVIPDAEIIGFSAMEATGDMVMVLAVTPPEAVILTWLIDAKISVQYRMVLPASPTQE